MECSKIESYRTIAVICLSVGWNYSKFISGIKAVNNPSITHCRGKIDHH